MDIEKELIDWLTKNIDVPVSADVPDPRPSAFLTVERTGGTCDSLIIDRPRVAIQCWAKTREKAAQLAYRLDELVPRMSEHPQISRATRNTLYNFPDLKGGNPRYQVMVDLVTTSV